MIVLRQCSVETLNDNDDDDDDDDNDNDNDDNDDGGFML